MKFTAAEAVSAVLKTSVKPGKSVSNEAPPATKSTP